MRASVIGVQPNGGGTPLAEPSQFFQYPCRTLPVGRDFTAQVVPPGEVDGDGGGDTDGDGDGGREGEGEADGDGGRDGEADGDGDGGVPSQAPRSVHSDGVAAGF